MGKTLEPWDEAFLAWQKLPICYTCKHEKGFSWSQNRTPELKESLDRLSKVTRRSLAHIVSEALQNYVECNAWQIEAILEGVQEAKAGNSATEEEVREFFLKWGVDV